MGLRRTEFVAHEFCSGVVVKESRSLTPFGMTVCGGVCALRRGERRGRIGDGQRMTDRVSDGEFAPQGRRKYGVRGAERVGFDPLPRYLRKNVILKGIERVMVQECDSKGVVHVSAGVLWVDGESGEDRRNDEIVRLVADSKRFKSKEPSACAFENSAGKAVVSRRGDVLQEIDPKWFERWGGAARRAFIGDLATDSGWHPDRSKHYSMKVIECQLITE
jgi:hypothetical protein